MKKHIRNALYFVLGVLGLQASSAQACIEMYMCIDTVDGESTSKLHPNCIDVLAWSWGTSQSGSMHVGGGGSIGKVAVQDLSVTKWLDKSTPDLLLHTASGKHFTKVDFHTYRCGETTTKYFSLELENVLVSSVSMGGSGGEDRLTENVSLNFQKVQWCYTPIGVDGKPGTEKCWNWDIAANLPY